VELTGLRLGYAGLSTSIGAIVFVPSEGDRDADALLAEADRRMYANKRRNKALNAANMRDAEKPLQGSLDLLVNEGSSASDTISVVVH
jgi:GGDEF domain-containing protein